MPERVFRIECCEDECKYPDIPACFWITPETISRCVRCKWQEIPDQNWFCEDCGMEFDRLEKYFERVTGPDYEQLAEAPEVRPGVRAVPAVAHIKRLCKDCWEEGGG